MSQDLELRYRELLEGFSTEELSRLPLIYSVYRDDLRAVIGSMGEDSSPLDPLDLTRLYELVRELAEDLQREVNGIELQDQNFPWDETERELLRDELSTLSGTTYSKILAEYFFLSNLAELMAIVLEVLIEHFGEGSFDGAVELLSTVRARIVEIFQEIDGYYESVQQWITDNSR